MEAAPGEGRAEAEEGRGDAIVDTEREESPQQDPHGDNEDLKEAEEVSRHEDKGDGGGEDRSSPNNSSATTEDLAHNQDQTQQGAANAEEEVSGERQSGGHDDRKGHVEESTNEPSHNSSSDIGGNSGSGDQQAEPPRHAVQAAKKEAKKRQKRTTAAAAPKPVKGKEDPAKGLPVAAKSPAQRAGKTKKAGARMKPKQEAKKDHSPAVGNSNTGADVRKKRRFRKRLDPHRHGIVKRNILHIYVAVNRSVRIPKTEVMFDPRSAPTLDHFLDRVTEALKNTNIGLVRRLHVAQTGKEVTDLGQLEDGKLFVACCTRRFKRMNYDDAIGYMERNEKYVPPDLERIKAKFDKPKEGPSIFESHLDKAPLVVYLVYNGESSGDYTQVLLTKKERISFEKVLDVMSVKMRPVLQYREIRHLFTLTGAPVTSLDQIKDVREGGIYVAVDRLPLRLPSVRLQNGRVVPVTPPPRLPQLNGDHTPGKANKQHNQHNHKRYQQKHGQQQQEQRGAKEPHAHVRSPAGDDDAFAKGRGGDGGGGVSKKKDRHRRSKGDAPNGVDDGHDAAAGQAEGGEDGVEEGVYDTGQEEKNKKNKKKKRRGSKSKPRGSEQREDGGKRQQRRGSKFGRIFSFGLHTSEDDNVDFAYDGLVSNILAFVLSREDEASWQTNDGQAVQHFESALQAAAQGRLSHWELQPDSLAALLLLLDHLPRYFGREHAEIYELDKTSLAILLRSVDSGVFESMDPLHKLFSCFVLSRQEHLNYQDMCLRMWDMMKQHLPKGYNEFGKTFKRNHDIINRFGRFPGRNEALGRESTPQEAKFLEKEQRRSKKWGSKKQQLADHDQPQPSQQQQQQQQQYGQGGAGRRHLGRHTSRTFQSLKPKLF